MIVFNELIKGFYSKKTIVFKAIDISNLQMNDFGFNVIYGEKDSGNLLWTFLMSAAILLIIFVSQNKIYRNKINDKHRQ